MAEEKKICFGFSKLKAPSKVIKPTITVISSKSQTNAVQYIDCLEDQSIKVKNEIVEEKKELIIPLKPSNVSQRIIKKEPDIENVVIKKEELTGSMDNSKLPNGNLTVTNVKIKEEVVDTQEANTLDAQARREILASLSKGGDEESDEAKVFSLPLTTNAPKEGEKESTLDDYENIPIQQFGMAMLRGMGWKPDETKKNNKPSEVILRPKGLGLGADKSAANAAKTKSTGNPEDSKLIKNCCVTITGGMYKNRYGKLESFNEDSGRVVVKLALGDEHVTVSETLLLRVTQGEYDKNSRVINMKKYSEYKDQDAKHETNDKDRNSKKKHTNSSDDEQTDRRTEKRKKHSKHSENSNSDSEQEKKYKKTYQQNDTRHEEKSRTQETIKSRRDNNGRRKDSTDSETESQFHPSNRRDDKYQSSRTHQSKENHQSTSSYKSRTTDTYERDEGHSRNSSKQKSSTRHETSSKKYMKSRNSSESSSDDEDRYKKTSKYERQDIQYDNRNSDKDRKRKVDKREHKKRSKKQRSSSESEDSSSEEDRKKKKKKKAKSRSTESSDEEKRNEKKKSRRHTTDSSDEDRKKKSSKSKHKASSSDDSEGERRKKKKAKKSKHR